MFDPVNENTSTFAKLAFGVFHMFVVCTLWTLLLWTNRGGERNDVPAWIVIAELTIVVTATIGLFWYFVRVGYSVTKRKILMRNYEKTEAIADSLDGQPNMPPISPLPPVRPPS